MDHPQPHGLPVPPTISGARVSLFLDAFLTWVRDRPDVVAAAVVGSWARGEARPDSDLDLLIVAREPAGYLAWTDWLHEFGKPGDRVTESWGAVRCLRVWYTDGPEVEFCIAGPAWLATDPPDPGSLAVLRGGVFPLHDPEGRLARLVNLA